MLKIKKNAFFNFIIIVKSITFDVAQKAKKNAHWCGQAHIHLSNYTRAVASRPTDTEK